MTYRAKPYFRLRADRNRANFLFFADSLINSIPCLINKGLLLITDV